jgi:hypothetical protein
MNSKEIDLKVHSLFMDSLINNMFIVGLKSIGCGEEIDKHKMTNCAEDAIKNIITSGNVVTVSCNNVFEMHFLSELFHYFSKEDWFLFTKGKAELLKNKSTKSTLEFSNNSVIYLKMIF